jgi:hypothetical protein
VHTHEYEEVIAVRKRHGQAARGPEAERVQAPGETEQTDSPSSRGSVKEGFSWITAITVGAGLALDIIRVLREAIDLKRKLFPAKDATADQVSNRESG